jgi:hypothetical protein
MFQDDIRSEFYTKTGKSFDILSSNYNPEYVHWLEDKVIELSNIIVNKQEKVLPNRK